MSKLENKRLLKQERLLEMAIEQWPGILSIKDYTDGTPRLVYMNERLLKYEGIGSVEDYYDRNPDEVLDGGEEFCAEDMQVLEENGPISFLNTDRYGTHWIKYKWPIYDGDSTYVVAGLIELNQQMISVFMETIEINGKPRLQRA